MNARKLIGILLFALQALIAPAPAGAQEFVVPPELWDRPRSGADVMRLPAVRQAVDAWLARSGARLVVRHGPGQETLLQAEEMRAWLIALSIDAARVTLRGDLKTSQPLQLEVERE